MDDKEVRFTTNIFRAIHEGKWLTIKYRNAKESLTRYWMAVRDFDPDTGKLDITGLHLGHYTIQEFTIDFTKIESADILEETYFPVNQRLVDDIFENPEKYEPFTGEPDALKVLAYLAECMMQEGQPSLCSDFTLIESIDDDSFRNGDYRLSDKQFAELVAGFQTEKESPKNRNRILTLALNLLSIRSKQGIYPLAYREVKLDVQRKTLKASEEIHFSKEFFIDGKKQILSQYIPQEDCWLLNDFEKNAEEIRELLTNNSALIVDDCPHIFPMQKTQSFRLRDEFNTIAERWNRGEKTVPLQAFFGELHQNTTTPGVCPPTLLNERVNLDQLLAIYNAVNYPVTYVQGPPGTGKTNTILNTIATAYFNEMTVLFSSYNNHPIDSVLQSLQSLEYRGRRIPFPVLKIANNDSVPAVLAELKETLAEVADVPVYDSTLKKKKQKKEESMRQLTLLLKKHKKQTYLYERRETMQTMIRAKKSRTLKKELGTRELSEISRKIREIGTVSEEEARNLLKEDENEEFLKYLNYTSIGHLKKLEEPEYEDFMAILNEKDRNSQITAFNKYMSVPENVEKLLKVFPVMTATCLSSHKIGRPQPLFDLTIIDEAGQCNTAASLMPVARGKRLMLVGDPQQLNPVITLDPQKNEELKKQYDIDDGYDYIKSSIYKSFLANDPLSEEILLHKHYRCSKEIIAFSNQKYYNNRLDISSCKSDNDALIYYEVCENRVSGFERNTSFSEAEAVVDYVKNHPDQNIGIITPFRNQKVLIDDLLKKASRDQIPCGTVHSFQGDEKDVILFSSALTKSTHPKSYEWLKTNRELINVAVSRAKSKLVLFGNKKVIRNLHAHPSDKKEKTDDFYDLFMHIRTNGKARIASYQTASRALGIKPYTTETETAFLQTLNQALSNIILKNRNLIVRTQVQIAHLMESLPGDHEKLYRTGSFDFVLYEKYPGSEYPVLILELDGKEHRENKTRRQCDKSKKDICDNHQLKLIRVPNTYARRYNFIKDILTDYFSE